MNGNLVKSLECLRISVGLTKKAAQTSIDIPFPNAIVGQ